MYGGVHYPSADNGVSDAYGDTAFQLAHSLSLGSEGAGVTCTLDGGEGARVLWVGGGSCTDDCPVVGLKDLVVQNGLATGSHNHGGGAYLDNAIVSMLRCTFYGVSWARRK